MRAVHNQAAASIGSFNDPFTNLFKTIDLKTISCFCIKPSISCNDKYDASKENWTGIKSVSWTLGRKKEEFVNLLKSQETLPMLEDIYHFSINDVKSMSYSKEGLITLALNKTSSIKIPTNVYKVNQVLCAGNI